MKWKLLFRALRMSVPDSRVQGMFRVSGSG